MGGDTPDHEGHEELEGSSYLHVQVWDGVIFMDFVFFMVKSRYVLVGCSNPGILLTLQVSQPPVNSTV